MQSNMRRDSNSRSANSILTSRRIDLAPRYYESATTDFNNQSDYASRYYESASTDSNNRSTKSILTSGRIGRAPRYYEFATTDYDNQNANSIVTSSRVERVPRFEYVNRQGERVNPHTGKPYDRKENAENATTKRKRHSFTKMSGVIFSGLDPVPINSNVDPPPRACFNCWRFGHSRRNCPEASTSQFCNNCGRRDVDVRTCPRCSRAYQKYLERYNLTPDDIEQIYRAEDKDNGDEYDAQEPSMRQEQEDEPCSETMICMTDYNSRRVILPEYYAEGENAYYNDDLEIDRYVREREKPLHHESAVNSVERSRLESPMRNYADGEDAVVASSSNHRYTASSAENSNSDPVQDILRLAQSIAHLSPETQELIMRQVIEERRENARLRAMREEEVGS